MTIAIAAALVILVIAVVLFSGAGSEFDGPDEPWVGKEDRDLEDL